MASGSHQGEPWSSSLSPTVTLVRNGPVNTACRTLIEESSGCEDDQAALQCAENRSCLAQVMRSVTVGLGAHRSGFVQRCRYGRRKTYLLRAWVNRGERRGPGSETPALPCLLAGLCSREQT